MKIVKISAIWCGACLIMNKVWNKLKDKDIELIELDYDMDEEEVYEITGSTEADAMHNKISNESPVGSALLNHKVGDTVKVIAPNTEYELKIMEIS